MCVFERDRQVGRQTDTDRKSVCVGGRMNLSDILLLYLLVICLKVHVLTE